MDTIGSSAVDWSLEDVLVAGSLDGNMHFVKDGAILKTVKVFKLSIRNIQCLDDGGILASSSNGFVAFIRDSNVEWKVKVSQDAISAIHYLKDVGCVAIGTDTGDLIVIECADPKKVIFKSDSHDDFISAIAYNGPKKTLVTCSGDGHMKAFDIKKGKEIASCECMEDELLCMALISNGTSICCGSASGVINIFEWGYFGVPAQRIKGFKSEVNCLSVVDGRRYIVGTSSGVVQLIEGEQRGAKMAFDNAIESICVGNSGNIAHLDSDGRIRIWHISELLQTNIPASKELDRKSFMEGFS